MRGRGQGPSRAAARAGVYRACPPAGLWRGCCAAGRTPTWCWTMARRRCTWLPERATRAPCIAFGCCCAGARTLMFGEGWPGYDGSGLGDLGVLGIRSWRWSCLLPRSGQGVARLSFQHPGG